MVGLGNTEVCFELLQFLHDLHEGYMRVGYQQDVPKEMNRKIAVLKQSLKKVIARQFWSLTITKTCY